MKKFLATLLSAVMVMALSTGAFAATSSATKLAYDKYLAANKKLAAADSVIMDMAMQMDMDMDGQAVSTVMDATVASVMEDGVPVQMDMDMTMTIPGMLEGVATEMYYEDGFAYMDTMGEKVKIAMAYEEFLEQASASAAGTVEFPAELITDASYKAAGNERFVSFTIDGEALTAETVPYLAQFSEMASVEGVELSDNITYGDMEISAVMDGNNNFKTMNIGMTMNMAMAVEGQEVEFAYDVVIDITFVQIGGVEIDVPEGLDAYVDITPVAEETADDSAAGDKYPGEDRSNLVNVDNEVDLGLTGKTSGSSESSWGQAAKADTLKNDGGTLDPALFVEGGVVTVYYVSANYPEVILQSWSGGAGWAKVDPAGVNDSGNIAQFTYADMVASFGSADFATLLDRLNVGDRGVDLEVTKVTIGTEAAEEVAAVEEPVVEEEVVVEEEPAVEEEEAVEEEPAVEEEAVEEEPAVEEEEAVEEEPAAPALPALLTVANEVDLGISGSSSGSYGQAGKAQTLKNTGGTLDPALFVEGCVVTVYYTSDVAPEIILQSWSGGAGWAKVAASAGNAEGTIAQFTYADMVASFGTTDFTARLDCLNVGDLGAPLNVSKVTIGTAE